MSRVLLTAFGLLTRSFVHVQAAAGGLALDEVIETGSDGGRNFGPAVAFGESGPFGPRSFAYWPKIYRKAAEVWDWA